MRYLTFGIYSLLVMGCGQSSNHSSASRVYSGQGPLANGTASNSPIPGINLESLVESRGGFQTKIVFRDSHREPVPEPPPSLFKIVRYDSPVGKLPAYLTPNPMDGQLHPAIIWITGGDCNSIGDVWSPASPKNDQTASSYRKAGMIMMFPSLRGGNDNPGNKEGFYGEVDDVIAAFEFLSQQSYVDPQRIYLGGHSTGGTLALLVAASCDRFRAVFAFGPVDTIMAYDPEYLPFDRTNRREVELRSPILWLQSIQVPLFIFEGTTQGNVAPLKALERASRNTLLKFFAIKNASHFSVLAPVNQLIASRILKDLGPVTNISFTEQELQQLFKTR